MTTRTNGINDLLCARLGLVDVGSLRPAPVRDRAAVVPLARSKSSCSRLKPEREACRSAAFQAGAGRIGAYEECSFAIPGEGTFFGTETANPTIGERGRRETVRELRLEFVCPSTKLAGRAGGDSSQSFLRGTCDRRVSAARAGCRGQMRLPASGASDGWPSRDRSRSSRRDVERGAWSGGCRRGRRPGRRVERLAIACGAGDDFLKDAARAGADALLTGEARFHRGIEAETLGIGLIVAGHYATERPGVEFLAARIGAGVSATLTVWPSRRERDAFSRSSGQAEA